MRRSEQSQQTQQAVKQTQKNRGASSTRCAADNIVVDRCLKCHSVLESYDDETVSLSIICLATFIHREPALAAPLLLDMLHSVSK